jgi:hypothetical protein
VNPHSPLWVRIEKALKLISENKAPSDFLEVDLILAAMAKEQDEYDAWVDAEEARYRKEADLRKEDPNETATEWLARMKKEGRI